MGLELHVSVLKHRLAIAHKCTCTEIAYSDVRTSCRTNSHTLCLHCAKKNKKLWSVARSSVTYVFVLPQLVLPADFAASLPLLAGQFQLRLVRVRRPCPAQTHQTWYAGGRNGREKLNSCLHEFPEINSDMNHYQTGFCSHWSAVVRSNHHSAFLTTTQLMFNSIYSTFNKGESLFS